MPRLDFGGNFTVRGVGTPSIGSDATNMEYVDSQVGVLLDDNNTLSRRGSWTQTPSDVVNFEDARDNRAYRAGVDSVQSLQISHASLATHFLIHDMPRDNLADLLISAEGTSQRWIMITPQERQLAQYFGQIDVTETNNENTLQINEATLIPAGGSSDTYTVSMVLASSIEPLLDNDGNVATIVAAGSSARIYSENDAYIYELVDVVDPLVTNDSHLALVDGELRLAPDIFVRHAFPYALESDGTVTPTTTGLQALDRSTPLVIQPGDTIVEAGGRELRNVSLDDVEIDFSNTAEDAIQAAVFTALTATYDAGTGTDIPVWLPVGAGGVLVVRPNAPSLLIFSGEVVLSDSRLWKRDADAEPVFVTHDMTAAQFQAAGGWSEFKRTVTVVTAEDFTTNQSVTIEPEEIAIFPDGSSYINITSIDREILQTNNVGTVAVDNSQQSHFTRIGGVSTYQSVVSYNTGSIVTLSTDDTVWLNISSSGTRGIAPTEGSDWTQLGVSNTSISAHSNDSITITPTVVDAVTDYEFDVNIAVDPTNELMLNAAPNADTGLYVPRRQLRGEWDHNAGQSGGPELYQINDVVTHGGVFWRARLQPVAGQAPGYIHNAWVSLDEIAFRDPRQRTFAVDDFDFVTDLTTTTSQYSVFQVPHLDQEFAGAFVVDPLDLSATGGFQAATYQLDSDNSYSILLRADTPADAIKLHTLMNAAHGFAAGFTFATSAVQDPAAANGFNPATDYNTIGNFNNFKFLVGVDGGAIDDDSVVGSLLLVSDADSTATYHYHAVSGAERFAIRFDGLALQSDIPYVENVTDREPLDGTQELVGLNADSTYPLPVAPRGLHERFTNNPGFATFSNSTPLQVGDRIVYSWQFLTSGSRSAGEVNFLVEENILDEPGDREYAIAFAFAAVNPNGDVLPTTVEYEVTTGLSTNFHNADAPLLFVQELAAHIRGVNNGDYGELIRFNGAAIENTVGLQIVNDRTIAREVDGHIILDVVMEVTNIANGWGLHQGGNVSSSVITGNSSYTNYALMEIVLIDAFLSTRQVAESVTDSFAESGRGTRVAHGSDNNGIGNCAIERLITPQGSNNNIVIDSAPVQTIVEGSNTVLAPDSLWFWSFQTSTGTTTQFVEVDTIVPLDVHVSSIATSVYDLTASDGGSNVADINLIGAETDTISLRTSHNLDIEVAGNEISLSPIIPGLNRFISHAAEEVSYRDGILYSAKDTIIRHAGSIGNPDENGLFNKLTSGVLEFKSTAGYYEAGDVVSDGENLYRMITGTALQGTTVTPLTAPSTDTTNWETVTAGGTEVIANPTGSDGTDLTRVTIDGTNYNLAGGGEGAGISVYPTTFAANFTIAQDSLWFAADGDIYCWTAADLSVTSSVFALLASPGGAGTNSANWELKNRNGGIPSGTTLPTVTGPLGELFNLTAAYDTGETTLGDNGEIFAGVYRRVTTATDAFAWELALQPESLDILLADIGSGVIEISKVAGLQAALDEGIPSGTSFPNSTGATGDLFVLRIPISNNYPPGLYRRLNTTQSNPAELAWVRVDGLPTYPVTHIGEITLSQGAIWIASVGGTYNPYIRTNSTRIRINTQTLLDNNRPSATNTDWTMVGGGGGASFDTLADNAIVAVTATSKAPRAAVATDLTGLLDNATQNLSANSTIGGVQIASTTAAATAANTALAAAYLGGNRLLQGNREQWDDGAFPTPNEFMGGTGHIFTSSWTLAADRLSITETTSTNFLTAPADTIVKIEIDVGKLVVEKAGGPGTSVYNVLGFQGDRNEDLLLSIDTGLHSDLRSAAMFNVVSADVAGVVNTRIGLSTLSDLADDPGNNQVLVWNDAANNYIPTDYAPAASITNNITVSSSTELALRTQQLGGVRYYAKLYELNDGTTTTFVYNARRRAVDRTVTTATNVTIASEDAFNALNLVSDVTYS